jgi:hypothetical protein
LLIIALRLRQIALAVPIVAQAIMALGEFGIESNSRFIMGSRRLRLPQGI